MPKEPRDGFSRRERQIMDVVYALGQATAAEIHEGLPDPPTYTAVRGLLKVLVDKGHLQVEPDGGRYLYRPTTPREAAGASLLSHVIRTFFGGSAAEAMAAIVGSPETPLRGGAGAAGADRRAGAGVRGALMGFACCWRAPRPRAP